MSLRQTFIALLLLSQPAVANNLLKCSFVSGTFLQNCAIDTVSLDARSFPYLMELTVNYRYDCSADFYLAVNSGTSQVDMPPRLDSSLPLVRSFAVQGTGPFSVIDTDPNWTQLTAATAPCNLSFEGTSIQLAPSTLAQFKDHVESYEQLVKVFSLVQNSAKIVGLLRNLVDKSDLETLQTFWETLRLQIKSAKDASTTPELKTSLDEILATIEYGSAENPSLEEGTDLQAKLKKQLDELDGFDGLIMNLGEEISNQATPHYVSAGKIASFGQSPDIKLGLEKLETLRKIIGTRE